MIQSELLPLITVVIPTYNRAHMITKAIKSVVKQTCKEWRILILDDASTDHTNEIIQPFLQDSNIQYIQLEENRGISHVMNVALSHVKTSYMLQLDSDDWLSSKTLHHLYRQIKQDVHKSEERRPALYYGNMKLCKLRNNTVQKSRMVLHRQFTDKYDFLRMTGYMIAPRCYRVAALKEVGGWDISDQYKGRIMEDRRMILRLIERYPITHIPKHLYHRTKHKAQLTDPTSIKSRNDLRRSTYKYYLKRWGNEYKAVFGKKGKFIVIKQLIEQKQKRKRGRP
ncbi:glycosyltransferase family 2 protein [Brevibacillus daliensis]|uniref:glycosyltransferase family 2 protein n=1 Tax=Brevibacillus daliensis TaxID=2892995 RepID=UPI001E5ACC8E|nr:glycosyltransferase family 2 protein [Brevibacillus daliensis]